MTDYGALYQSAREILSREVRDAPDGALERPVPATPAWSVHDVCAHLSGTAADVNAGRLDGIGSDEWTAAQVETRRTMSTEVVLEEWATESEPLAAAMAALPAWAGAQLVGDTLIHGLDVESVVGAHALHHHDGVPLLVQYYGKLASKRAVAAGLAPLFFGEPGEEVPDGKVGVRGSAFELFRALTGRRSVAQIRSLDWGGADPGPFLALVPNYPPPASDLPD